MACIIRPLKTEDDQPLTNLFLVNLGMCFLSEDERSKMFTLKCSWPLLLLCDKLALTRALVSPVSYGR